jgi:hypothetical protein
VGTTPLGVRLLRRIVGPPKEVGRFGETLKSLLFQRRAERSQMTGEALADASVSLHLEKRLSSGSIFRHAAILARARWPADRAREQTLARWPSNWLRSSFAVNSVSNDAREQRRAEPLQLGPEARRERIGLVFMLVKSGRLGLLDGRLTGDGMLTADVAVAQSQANPFQRAMENASLVGSPASAQLISRSATACPVSHSRSPLHGSSSRQCFGSATDWLSSSKNKSG